MFDTSLLISANFLQGQKRTCNVRHLKLSDNAMKTLNTIHAAMMPDFPLLAVIACGTIQLIARVCHKRVLDTAVLEHVDSECTLGSISQTELS